MKDIIVDPSLCVCVSEEEEKTKKNTRKKLYAATFPTHSLF